MSNIDPRLVRALGIVGVLSGSAAFLLKSTQSTAGTIGLWTAIVTSGVAAIDPERIAPAISCNELTWRERVDHLTRDVNPANVVSAALFTGALLSIVQETPTPFLIGTVVTALTALATLAQRQLNAEGAAMNV